MKIAWETWFGALGVLLFVYGCINGLFIAPPERFMGDVGRIIYVHVPAAWAALLCFCAAFIAAIGWLVKGGWGWDAAVEATVEAGTVLGALLLALGCLWARPTWGVWWDWDPRLTSMAVLEIAFLGVIALRSFVDDMEQRARWSAVATILASVNTPIVYMSVKWWKTLHQPMSEGGAIDPAMRIPLYTNAFALMFLGVWFVARRWRIAMADRAGELTGPDGQPLPGVPA